MSDVFDLFPTEEPHEINARLQEALESLRKEVEALPRDFKREPDLTLLAMAVQDVLSAVGAPTTVAEAWLDYERSHRASSKREEARSRANAVYLQELEALEEGWSPLQKSKDSTLPWRKPS